MISTLLSLFSNEQFYEIRIIILKKFSIFGGIEMFCVKCGTSLSEDLYFCSKCGAKVESEVQKTESPLNQPEKVIMEGLCNRVKNKLYVQNGKALLTNHRFIYLKHTLIKTIAVGILVNLTSGDFDFDIPLTEILSIEDGRQGLSKTIIINTKSGEMYNFYFTKREEWKIAIQSAMQSIK